VLCMSITTLPRPLNFASILQYKRDAIRHCRGGNVVQSHNVVLQYGSQKEQSVKGMLKKGSCRNKKTRTGAGYEGRGFADLN